MIRLCCRRKLALEDDPLVLGYVRLNIDALSAERASIHI